MVLAFLGGVLVAFIFCALLAVVALEYAKQKYKLLMKGDEK